MKKLAAALIGAGLLSAHMGAAHATAMPDEAKKLGTSLTLFGAEKAGNKDGTIPEYTGGLTTAPAGFDKARGVRPDRRQEHGQVCGQADRRRQGVDEGACGLSHRRLPDASYRGLSEVRTR
jgi:hypothetical protein